jgi:2-oxoglutarate/2-oxoacid ferredoxin oxidoreductase subunit beta
MTGIPVERVEGLRVLSTKEAPQGARLVDDFTPKLIDVGAHHLCPGCGEPIAMRSVLEIIEELGAIDRAIAVFGIGCYTAFSNNLDCEVAQALHGRAPSVATGIKRMKTDTVVFTIQGDGDMVNEGLQEVIHAAARGERITCVMLNNGVFGETGGHITSTTVLGQRTKNTLEGRDGRQHGYPIRLSNMLTDLEGVAFVGRTAVNNAGNVARTRKMLRRAFETQINDEGFSFVEILTMCPTGWFIDTHEAPAYLNDKLAATHSLGVLKDIGAPS